MITKPGPLDEAEIKLGFRRLYKEQGFRACIQVLYELMKAAQWMGEIIKEESKNESTDPWNSGV